MTADSADPRDVAVIGVSCRLPGAANPEEFWQLLRGGGCAVTDDPPPGRPFGTSGGPGGYLDAVEDFDPEFFGLSPREASATDPQQRLMLELVWEALEQGGILPGSLAGSRTGVYVGAVATDYAALLQTHGLDAVDHHTMTGLSRGVIANRVSHVFELRGPSFAVDAGQASSLLAVHLAARSLRDGESKLAIAGGVQLNLADESAAAASAFGGLSPDGRCFTFDARANGYVRGEGGGVVVLKPLAAAVADGNTVHAVIRGSATNNDGATDGLTTPSAAAQSDVLRRAYEIADTDPGAVRYVELHGTGTPAGDPVEAAALGAVLGVQRENGPLLVGSVKTNIGHLEGAAGIAGLLKVVLALRHGELPPTVGYADPSPDFALGELGLRVVTTPTPTGSRPWIAGVSSFGMGGTNCHVVLAAPPAAPAVSAPATSDGALVPWLLSGHNAAGLRGQAERLHTYLSGRSEPSTSDLAWSLANTRTAFSHRAVVLGRDTSALADGLAATAAGLPGASVVTGVAARGGRVVLMFPGQGSQWVGMARELWGSSAVFGAAMDRCAAALAPHVSFSLREVLDGAGPEQDRVDVVQPALFSVMVALAALWESWGVRPDAVMGHSQGEIAAACVAGALSLPDAARVIAVRSGALRRLHGGGAMWSVELPVDEVETRLDAAPDGVGVAAINGPRQVVLSGDDATLAELTSTWAAEGVRVRRLPVDYASHNEQVLAVREHLLGELADLRPSAGHLPFYSTVDAERVPGTVLDATYWYRNLRNTVRFHDTCRSLLAEEHQVFIECSPHPVLVNAVQESINAVGSAGAAVGSLRRTEGGQDRMVAAAAEAFVAGAPVDWVRVLAETGRPGSTVDLPTYAFQRRRCWLDCMPAPTDGLAGPGEAAEAMDLVRAQTAAVLGHADGANIDPQRTFSSLGVNSVLVVELSKRLSAVTGRILPPSSVFDHPTPEALADVIGARELAPKLAARHLSPSAGDEADPLVIVGMACRYPGGIGSPEDLWQVVRDGLDAVGPPPPDREWATGARFIGGFLDGAGDFDAGFFGLSPREAIAMDPQQRLLLELSCEALERSGIAPDSLHGSLTGVFVGAMAGDYGPSLQEADDAVAGYRVTGAAGSVASGRIAYQLGLQGPAMTVDTACSSSLVALHAAARALRAGECDLALTGGATVMATPGMFLEFERQGGLASDGRCKAFAATADGTAWGEGAAMLVLERRSDARRRDHPVLAVLRGSAVNADGASNGLTAPNGTAQQRLIGRALAAAGLSAAEVDAVEAHGTGTTLGDPIEAQALLAAYGRDHSPEHPLWIGSLKSNIGHTQAAAGVGGVIKVVQALRHAELPRTLHVDELSPHVDWNAGAVRVLTESRPWAGRGRPRRAAVSSFGISGTNAHVILEEAAEPDEKPVEGPEPSVIVWPLSAPDPDGLCAQAALLRAHLEGAPELASADIGLSLATGRSTLNRRAVLFGADRATLMAALAALAADEPAPGLIRSSAHRRGGTAFLFPGQGAQRVGMGRGLHSAFPAFATAFDEVCAHLDERVRDVMWSADATALNRTEFTQPALFAIEVALFRLFESWGLRPDVVLGHSIGELAAAHVAGVFSLPDAARLVSARARLMGALPPGGAMTAVQATEEEARPLLTGRVGIAAINGPEAVVLSGDADAVAEVAERFSELGRRTRKLLVSHAFHSPLVDPVLAEFAEVAASVTYAEPGIPVVSNVTGGVADADELRTPDYWVRHVREPVRFCAGVRAAGAAGAIRFVELGPGSGLAAATRDCLDPAFVTSALVTSRTDYSEAETVTASLAGLHASGHSPDWSRLFPGARRVALPPYAFQRLRYWLPATRRHTNPGITPVGHPFLGAAVTVAGSDEVVLSGRIAVAAQPWLADHLVLGARLVPGAVVSELAVRAGDEVGCSRLEDLTLEIPLVLSDDGVLEIQAVVAGPRDGGVRALSLYARRADAGAEWRRHATGLLAASGAPPGPRIGSWPPSEAEPVDISGCYERLTAAGFGYGPAFLGLHRMWRDGADHFAEVALPEEVDVGSLPFALHPALLDAALHPLLLDATPRVPFSWNGVELHATGATRLRVHIVRTGPESVTVSAFDDADRPIVSVETLTLRPMTREQLGLADVALPHRLDWVPVAASGTPRHWVLVEDDPVRAHHPDAAVAASARAASETGADVVVLPVRDVHTVLDLLRCWVIDDHRPTLALLTRHAVGVEPGDDPDPESAALWGLVRTAQTEHPGRFVLIDVDDHSLDAVGDAITSGAPQVVVRRGEMLAPRLTRAPSEALPLPPTGGWRLDRAKGASMTGIVARPCPEVVGPLRPGEVRVAVRVAGVNFRDVLNSLGRYPGKAGPLGLEGAGVVIETGIDVTGIRPGERVFGLFAGAFGPVVLADARLLARIPAGWSFARAATTPIAFLTAQHALIELADLREGETVLIHAAAGGVGMAAVQLAQRVGAEIFATASPDKHDVLRAHGMDDAHIASSRSSKFADHFLATTGGRGVDVVLNSLTGELIDASLRLLPRGGRFVEMGKTDPRDPAVIAAEHPAVDYMAFDLLDLPADRLESTFADVLALVAGGQLKALPTRAFDLRHAPAAFRYVGRAQHVGRVALVVPHIMEREGTVLITGGTGGLGPHLARHLVSRLGIRHLTFVSRRGANAPGADALAAELSEQGARVRFAAADVSDRDALAAVLSDVPAEHPVTAVLHLAGVLDDGTLEAMTTARLERVLRSKVLGARHLHELTAELDLACFVLFSSIAGTIGTAGQGAYAAANASLDALAWHRRAKGLPALSLAWGPWATDAGMTGNLTNADLERFARAGVAPLPVRQALDLFDAALARPDAVLVPFAPTSSGGAAPPEALARPRVVAGGLAGSEAYPEVVGLAAAPPAERRRQLLHLIREHSAVVLGHANSVRVDPEESFSGAGFDSLTSIELSNRLAAAIGRPLPGAVLFNHPTPAALADHLDTLFNSQPSDQSAGTAPARIENVHDPIAIVGMACRLPGGVVSPDDLWRLVSDETDAISGFPQHRGWDLERLFGEGPGSSATRAGGFVYDADMFDSAFFGVTPREAAAMDPQQRLLLETAWEAIERAGIVPESLRDTKTGVYIGVIGQEYGPRLHEGTTTTGGHLLTGSTASVASGRVAFALGLSGPAITIDTACSSSLVSTHLAVQALRRGECDLALAGGATVMASPGMFVEFSRQGGLARDGRCKAFAADADGTAWGEGAGLVLLSRLSDARRLGHPIAAVIRGSAVNSDGASNGLTAPNAPAQVRVIRAALADARLSAADVDAVEAHGTGTPLGDPIEIEALLEAYGQSRQADQPLWLGSLKSNVGHTQAAAGVAGLIKIVAALMHERLPRTLHLAEPTPRVNWEAGQVEPLRQARHWPAGDVPRRAAVSAFGISGTNAHLVVEEAPTTNGQPEQHSPPVVPCVLTARDQAALRAQALQLEPGEDGHGSILDIGVSLATTRSAWGNRAVVLAADEATLVAGLRAVASGAANSEVVSGIACAVGQKVFVFPGQGGQWPGMAADLIDTAPAFAEHLTACAEAFAPLVDWSLIDAVRSSRDLERVDVLQPTLFAVSTGLAILWQSMGIHPDAVVGHSQGEIAAAYISGALSLADAARLVVLRSRALAQLAGTGAMAAVQSPAHEVRSRLARYRGEIEVAAMNDPTTTIVSGAIGSLTDLLASYEADGVRARRLQVDYASHSPSVERIRDEVHQALDGIVPRSCDIPFYSTVTGGRLDTAELDAQYWYRNLREPVRFESAVRALHLDGHNVFVETSPHPLLTLAIEEVLAETGAADDAVVVGTLHRHDGGWRRFLTSAAQAYVRGVHVDWTSVFTGTGARRVELPTYPFQRASYWLAAAAATGNATDLGLDKTGHPLLLGSVELPDDQGMLFTGQLSTDAVPWLAGHALHGVVVMPGTALLEMAMHAGARVNRPHVRELIMGEPLVLAGDAYCVRVAVGASGPDGDRSVKIDSRSGVGGTWTRHAEGTLSWETAARADPVPEWPPLGAHKIDLSDAYDRLAHYGHDYGPAFQGLRALWCRGDDLFAEVVLPESDVTNDRGFRVHPALLDAALHSLRLNAPSSNDDRAAMVPFCWEGVTIVSPPSPTLRVALTARDAGSVSLTVADAAGAPLGGVNRLMVRPVDRERLMRRQVGALHTLDWVDVPVSTHGAATVWSVFEADATALGVALRAASPGEAGPNDMVLLPCPAAGDDIPRAVEIRTAQVLARLQQHLLDDRPDAGPLVVVTSGAIVADAADELTDLAGAPLWGLVRSAQTEHPGRFVLVDLDDDDASRGALAGALGTGEPQLVLRHGAIRVPRLNFARKNASASPSASPWRRDGTVLVTGGTGMAGRAVSTHLVAEHDVRHLLLLGRHSREAAGIEALTAELTELGAEVTIAECDVADRAALAWTLARIPAKRPLIAVVHAAGVLDDAMVTSLTVEHLRTVFASKVRATWNLHELTRLLDLDAFVLFSSVSGTLGTSGQAGYAAANAFVEAVAEHRRRLCLPGAAIAWGRWAQTSGMTAHLTGANNDRLAAQGIGELPTSNALELFDRALDTGLPVTLPAILNLATIGEWSPLIRVKCEQEDDPVVRTTRLRAMPLAERRRALRRLVRAEAAAVAALPESGAVGPDWSFRDAGFDSLMAVELRNRLTRATGLPMSATLVFDHPTVAALAEHLDERLNADGMRSPGATTPVDPIDDMDADALIRHALGEDSVGEWDRAEEQSDDHN